MRLSRVALWLLAMSALSAAFAARATETVTLIGGEEQIRDLLAQAIAEAQRQLASDPSTGIGALLTSAPFVMLVFALGGAVVTYFATNGIKLSTHLRGRSTQIVAAVISLLTAGVGGYLGLSEVAGVTGWSGALLGVLTAAGALFVAQGKHEEKRYAETGLRKPERKAAQQRGDTVAEKVTEATLRFLAARLGVPWFVVEPLLDMMPIEQVEQMVIEMGRRRAMTPDEAAKNQSEWREANAVTEGELEKAKQRAEKRGNVTVSEGGL